MLKEVITIPEILLWYEAMGIDRIILDPANPQNSSESVKTDSLSTALVIPEQQTPQATSLTTSRQLADQAADLASLKAAVMAFEGCALKKFARNTVFADGIPTAKVMLIGEAPGMNEDEQGIPFCGESGKLLDNMLKAIGLDRKENVYITNTIFWRPPANRNPTLEEVEICRPFVEKHLALIKPQLLILVGSVAANSLLQNAGLISKIRQNYYQYTNCYLETPIAATAIFHPAYLLRQPLQKATAWSDLLRIKHFLQGQN